MGGLIGLLDEDEEDRLAKKLFGDNHVNLTESSDEDEDVVVEKEIPSASVWHDEDDLDDEVQIPSSKSAVFLKRSADSGGCVASDEYQNRLRKAFERQQHGTPKWAKLEPKEQKAKQKGTESDDEIEEVFEEMTRSAQRYVDKDPFLVKDVVSTFRWPDITIGHHDNRPINVLLFHNVRPVVLTAGGSGKVQLFRVGDRLDSGNFLQNVQFSNFPVTSMNFMHGGCSVVCGSVRQEYIMKYDLEKGTVMQLNLPKSIPRQNAGHFTVSFDGSLLAMIGHSAQVHIFSASSMELVKTFSSPTDVTSLQFLPGSSQELWAMTDASPKRQCDFRRKANYLLFQNAVRSSSGAYKVFSTFFAMKVLYVEQKSNTGIVNVYDVSDVRKNTDPKPLMTASNLVTSCDSIAFNHDSQVMAFSSNVKKNQVKLLHVASRTVFNNFPKKNEKMTNIECVEFSPHSAYLGIGCSNGQLILERINHFEDY
ncbi:hypothetical protein OESDEN_00396 [Oesophagostomum dentatum]|uniref:WD domain, G-beta repeat protein n=1 Tax=Oesophagostomum dentatum TaxID=61180 RepID=A0A0B1TW41_OESDE|nr:hypothetical protein OESDEN_00396 [Oesophagostomum dentatum]